MVYPQTDDTVNDGEPPFQWTLVDGACGYRVQIATNPAFSPDSVVIDHQTGCTLSSTLPTKGALDFEKVGARYVMDSTSNRGGQPALEGNITQFVPTTALPDGDYYWRVKAFYTDATATTTETSWSQTGHFAIKTEYASDFTDTVPLPTDLSSDPKVIGTNFLFAVILVLLFYIAATLFNSTVKENYETIHGWLTRPFRRFLKPNAEGTHRSHKGVGRFLLEGFGVVVITSILSCFLDPHFTDGIAGLTLFIAITIAIAIVTFFYEGIQILFSKYFFRVPAVLKIHPIAMMLAVVFVIISRVVHFSPGLIFGFVGACVPLLASRRLNKRQDGISILTSTVLLAIICCIAFFARTPVADAIAAHDSFGWELLNMTLTAIFVTGLEGLVFTLLPLMFVDGERLAKWNKWLWLVTFTIVVFLFYYIIINRDGGIVDAIGDIKVRMMFVITGVVLVLSVAIWLGFGLRHKLRGGRED